MFAAQRGYVGVALSLLEAGADKDVANNISGATVLISAAAESHVEAVRLLLKAGSTPQPRCWQLEEATLSLFSLH